MSKFGYSAYGELDYKSEQTTVKKISRGKIASQAKTWFDETIGKQKESTDTAKNLESNDTNLPDYMLFNDPRTGELIFKIKGNFQIEFGDRIEKNLQNAKFIDAIRNYLPRNKTDLLNTRAALHYCYAAMQAASKDSENGGKLSEETAKLWEAALAKAKECFY
jgi:hypothetical protein